MPPSYELSYHSSLMNNFPGSLCTALEMYAVGYLDVTALTALGTRRLTRKTRRGRAQKNSIGSIRRLEIKQQYK